MTTDQWTRQLDGITADFRQTFGHLTAAQLNQKPAAGTWSVAQNIDHLVVTNETYFPILDALAEGRYKKPFLGRFGFLVRFFGQTVLKAVRPDRRRKMKTFSLWEPHDSELPADTVERFAAHQEALKQKIRHCSEALNRGTVIASPANKNIVYRLQTAFDIITSHEQRHFEQAREVLRQMHATGDGKPR